MLGLRPISVATQTKAHRIVAWTITLIALAILGIIAYGRFAMSSPPVESPSCDPLPSNVAKLGPAVIVSRAALPELDELGWPKLRAKLRQGDKLHGFETQVTGGHLAMRGDCYLGQTIAWIR